jgi:hypothetical protein
MNSSSSSSPTVTLTETQTVVFARAVWETTWVDGKIERVLPIPETWYDLRAVEGRPVGADLVALFSCPRCKNVNAVSKRVTKVTSLGKLVPRFTCGFSTCRFTAEVYLDEFSKKPLYALAMENGKEIELSYTHADNVKEASRGVAGKVAMGWRVISIGRAVGFHVQPGSKGSVLIA